MISESKQRTARAFREYLKGRTLTLDEWRTVCELLENLRAVEAITPTQCEELKQSAHSHAKG